MLPSAPAFMLPTAHLHHYHHHHHFQPAGAAQPADPQWQAHPHFHVRSAGRGVDLGSADSFALECQQPADDEGAAAAAGGGGGGGASGPFDISPAGTAAPYASSVGGAASGLPSGDAAAATEPSDSASGGMYGMYGRGGDAVQYPKLRNLQWLWSCIVWYCSTVAWFVTMPWRVLTWMSPSFLRPAEQRLEQTLWWWMGPVVQMTAAVLYGIIAWFDGMMSYVRHAVLTTHSSNMHHFWVAYEAYLRLIQHKAHLVEQHGFEGLWMGLHAKTV